MLWAREQSLSLKLSVKPSRFSLEGSCRSGMVPSPALDGALCPWTVSHIGHTNLFKHFHWWLVLSALMAPSPMSPTPQRPVLAPDKVARRDAALDWKETIVTSNMSSEERSAFCVELYVFVFGVIEWSCLLELFCLS